MASTLQISQLEKGGLEPILEKPNESHGVMKRPRIEPIRPVGEIDPDGPMPDGAMYNDYLESAEVSRKRTFKCHIITDNELQSLRTAYGLFGVAFTVMLAFISFWIGVFVKGGIPKEGTLEIISLYTCATIIVLAMICMKFIADWISAITSNLGEETIS